MNRYSLQYASNLFIDLNKFNASALKPVAKNLLLLGNIGRWENKKTRDFFKHAHKTWEHVFWVPGPHDISSSLGKNPWEIYDDIRKDSNTTCLLDQSEIPIHGTNIVILGGVLLGNKAKEDHDWLKERLDCYKTNLPDRKLIVCTHMSPFQYIDSPFYNNTTVQTWFYGGSETYIKFHKNILFLSNGSFAPQSVFFRQMDALYRSAVLPEITARPESMK